MDTNGLSQNELTKLNEAELDALSEELALNVERMREASREDVLGAMIECGCPRRDAESQFANPQLEGYARQFYLDWLDAKTGNPAAKDRVERCREAWGKMTKRREAQR